MSLSDIYIINGTRVFGCVFSYSGNIFDSFHFADFLFFGRMYGDLKQQANFRRWFMKGSFRVSHYRG